jgi:hypothetical protein
MKPSKKKARTYNCVLVKAASSVSFDSEGLMKKRSVPKERALYVRMVSERALSLLSA